MDPAHLSWIVYKVIQTEALNRFLHYSPRRCICTKQKIRYGEEEASEILYRLFGIQTIRADDGHYENMPDLRIVNSDRYIEVTHTYHDFDAAKRFPEMSDFFSRNNAYSANSIQERITTKGAKYLNRNGKIDLFCFATAKEIVDLTNLIAHPADRLKPFTECVSCAPFQRIYLCEFDIFTRTDMYCINALRLEYITEIETRKLYIITRS